ncbi:MAG: hypothetical protein KDB79_01135 [Acidobacteria bacterium]|nr:hypothetical protein [Acidobacteriota bacterium]
MAKAKANDTMEKAMELTQESAKMTLKGAVQTVELTENYIQGLYKVGYDTNLDAMKVAKNYWDAATEIRQDWVKLFAQTGETLIDATAKFEIPTVKDVTDFGKGVYNNVSKTVSNMAPQTKAASK